MTSSDPVSANKPSSVYIHVPFCRKRCGYCNFTLVAGRDYLVDDYLRALEREMSRLDERLVLQTLYLGGGTPSQLAPPALQQLLQLVDRYFVLSENCEFTIEANPEDLPGEIGATIKASPVNRISLGVQSFDSDRLRLLDRDHTPAQIRQAVDFAREIVPRLSLDLIFGVPGDTPLTWQRDLAMALDTGAGHLSTYELTIEKGTRFWNRQSRQETVRSDDDRLADLYELTLTTLAENGLEHYEVSSFARPGQRSRHNLVYWSGEPWLALGPGAAGLVRRTRYTNHRSVMRYLREVLAGRSARAEVRALSAEELALDQIVFGLRRLQGVDLNAWSARTGFALSRLVRSGTIDALVEAGLLDRTPNTLKLTHRGLLHGDHVSSQILNAALAAGSDSGQV